MRIAAPVLGPVWLIEFRVLIAGLALLPVVARLNLLSEIRKHWLALLIVGCINFAVPFSLLAYASVSLNAGFTSILNATTPLFGTVVALFWLKEKLTPTRLTGLVLGFIGVVILIGWQAVTPDFTSILAMLAGLSAAILYAIAAPFVRQKLAGVHPLATTAGSQLWAAALLIPVLPFTMPRQQPTLLVIASVLALALFSTAFACILYFRLIQNIGSTRVLTVTYIIPIFAIVWGAIFLRENITPSMVVGCSLILLGTAIANGAHPLAVPHLTRKRKKTDG